MSRKLDALFVNADSSLQAYQGLTHTFGERKNVKAMASIKLKRKILGD